MKFLLLFFAFAFVLVNVYGQRKEDCDRCTSDRECRSRVCTDGKCGTERVRAECPKAMCASCMEDSECKGMNCYAGICTNETYQSLLRCGLLRRCKDCTMDTDCATKQCYRGKCVWRESDYEHCRRRDRESSPTPRPGKEDCDRCTMDDECRSGTCTNGKCGSERVRAECPKAMCAKCMEDSECKGMNCYAGICTNETYQSLLRCGLLRRCKDCTMNTDCATKQCYRGKCVWQRSDLEHCRRRDRDD